MYVSDLLILTENMLGSLKKVIILDPVTLGQGQIIQYGHQKEKYFIFLDTKACESHKKIQRVTKSTDIMERTIIFSEKNKLGNIISFFGLWRGFQVAGYILAVFFAVHVKPNYTFLG